MRRFCHIGRNRCWSRLRRGGWLGRLRRCSITGIAMAAVISIAAMTAMAAVTVVAAMTSVAAPVTGMAPVARMATMTC